MVDPSCFGVFSIIHFAEFWRYAVSLVPFIFVLFLVAFTIKSNLRHMRAHAKSATLLFFLIVIVGFALNFRAELLYSFISPDETEAYAAARLFLLKGVYAIDINGVLAPSRYPPWFSVILIAPWLLVVSPEWISIIPSLYFGLLLGTVFLLASRYSGYLTAGIIAVLLLMSLPGMTFVAPHLLTHIPAALFLVLAILSTKSKSGLCIALAAACRPMYVIFIIPFLWSARRDIPRMALLSAPLGALFLLNASYQYLTFGSILITGYHFWLPYLLEEAGATFALKFLAQNLESFAIHSGALVYSAALALIALRKQSEFSHLLSSRIFEVPWKAVSFAASIFVIVHLFYFYPGELYFLPANLLLILALSCVAAYWLANSFPKLLIDFFLAFASVAVLIVVLVKRDTPHTIAAADPAYLRALSDFSGETTAPAHWEVEYTSKLKQCWEYRGKMFNPESALERALVPQSQEQEAH